MEIVFIRKPNCTVMFKQVVDESFFDLIDPEEGTVANTLQLIKQHNIADWGSDVSVIKADIFLLDSHLASFRWLAIRRLFMSFKTSVIVNIYGIFICKIPKKILTVVCNDVSLVYVTQ